MFAEQNGSSSTNNDQQSDDDGGQFFDERSEIHEVYWIACDANRRNGPQILQNDDLTVKGTDGGVSGAVDDYRFFNDQKKELIEEITGEKDMYGLRKYRQDFSEPDEEMWKEAGSEEFGITIVGVHKIPADEAQERFNVDYDKDGVDPMFVPILEDDGEEIVYDPVDFYDSEPEPDSDSDSEPEFPADPDMVMEYLEEQPLDDLTKQARATLTKLRDPTKVNKAIADEVGCSKNTVRKGLKKFLGDDGYDDIKERGKELRSASADSDGYEKKMVATTDGGPEVEADDSEESEVVRVDAEAFAELEGRIERLESMFDSELLERL